MTMRVTQHLNFNVARFFHKFFDEHAVIAKAVAGLIATRSKALVGIFVIESHAQALATTASRGFDHHRVAN